MFRRRVTWTRQVCRIMAFWAIFRGFGSFFLPTLGGLGKRRKTKEVEEAPKTARLSQDGLSDLKGPLNLTYASEGPYRN